VYNLFRREKIIKVLEEFKQGKIITAETACDLIIKEIKKQIHAKEKEKRELSRGSRILHRKKLV